jgi:hypothetical protein
MAPKRKKPPKTRDYLMVAVIKGATKAGVHRDEKKESDRRECRDWQEEEE